MRSLLVQTAVSMALLVSTLGVVQGVQAQGFPSLPAIRFYGYVTVGGQAPVGGFIVTAESPSGFICGSGATDPSTGAYSVDIQTIGDCLSSISFFVNDQQADQTATPASVLSGAERLNLTVSQFPPPPGASYAAPNGRSVTYAAGWNLVATPPGTTFPGLAGSLYTFQPGDTSYETVSPTSLLNPGFGYWAFFRMPTTVPIASGGPPSITLSIAPGQIAMIGDPFATPATVSGAGPVFTYDPGAGYRTATVLQPGEGAWATSLTGTIVIAATGS